MLTGYPTSPYARTVVLIDPAHDAAQTGPAASLTVPYGVALDDSLRLLGVSFVSADLLDGHALTVTLSVAAEHLTIKPNDTGGESVLIHGISVLTPPREEWGEDHAEGTLTVRVYAKAVLVRSARAEETEPSGWDGYQHTSVIGAAVDSNPVQDAR